MKAAAILSTVVLLGMGGTYLAQEPAPLIVVTPVIQKVKLDPLERARRATFLLYLKDYHVSGTAVLVGRKALDNGQYRYRALTAHHVVKEMAEAFAKDKGKASHKLGLIFQVEFHGKPLRLELDVEDMDWLSPTEDWASLTFLSTEKLECVEVATEAEFKTIKVFEPIYAIGCGGGFGQSCQVGSIGATHNEYLHSDKRIKKSPRKWDKYPHKFFRPFIDVWYGDSGGGIFNKQGKLIGIINGYNILRDWGGGPVTHSAVAIKAHIIRDIVQSSVDFFLVEKQK